MPNISPNGAKIQITKNISGIEEAPVDGNEYARKDAGWSKVPKGAETFTQLTDTPDTYVGQSGSFVKVNDTATGLEFTRVAPGEFDVNSIITAAITLPVINPLQYEGNALFLIVTDNDGNVLTI